MIIELSEKFNINSKYTSFITVYERKDKLLEVPKYQETKLSNKFAKDALMNKVWNMFGMNECEEEYCDMDNPSFIRKKTSSRSNDLDIPCFVRRKKTGKIENTPVKVKKINREILEEKVNEIYTKLESMRYTK